jgi:hypothetical protein
MSARRSLIGLCLGLAAAACTPVQWQHATLGVAPSDAEKGECNQSAYYEAQRQAFYYGDFAWPHRFYGRPYRPWPYHYSTSDRFFLEQDLFNYCMRSKGYRLVPTPNA